MLGSSGSTSFLLSSSFSFVSSLVCFSSVVLVFPEDKVILKGNYKLQRPESDNKYMKKGAKAKGIFTSDIGHKSEGFAPIFTLAAIIAISVITIAYFMWRF